MDGDGLGLKVKITPVIDRSQLNSEGKKVENQLNKNIKLSGTGDFGKTFEKMMPKSMRSALGSSGSKGPFGSVTGGGGGLGKAAVAGGVAGLAMAGIQGILEILKKMFSLMVEASPSLKAILKMLNQGFMMILRPMGDVLAMMLRPIAVFFRLIGRSVIKKMREKRAELKGEGLTGAALGGALMAEMPSIYLDAIMEVIAGVDWGSFFDKMLGVLWDNLTQRLPEFIGKVYGIIYNISMNFWTGVANALSGFGQWVWNTITSKIGSMDNLKSIATSIYDAFVSIYNVLADLAGYLGIKVDKILTSSQQAAFSQSSHDAEKRNFYAYHPELAPKADTGGYVAGTGFAIIHKGERVLTPAETSAYGSGGAINVNLNIPGSALADAIDRRIDTYFRTKVVARR